MAYHHPKPEPDGVPPVGLAPEGQDFVHPWVVSAIVSAVSFAVGFPILYFTGLWSKIWQWADAPFMIYFAILAPVLLGFTIYGVCVSVRKFSAKR